MSLLKYATANTTMEVQFKRDFVDLRDERALEHPVLFLTGHYDFRLTDEELAGLRRYLRNGGILVASACCGRDSFDAAFRREMERVLPGFKLKRIPGNHPLFSSRYQVTSVQYTGQLQAEQPDMTRPVLEGIELQGSIAVLYSRYGLGTGWDGQERPYSRAYSPQDALKLGVNILVYAMTH